MLKVLYKTQTITSTTSVTCMTGTKIIITLGISTHWTAVTSLSKAISQQSNINWISPPVYAHTNILTAVGAGKASSLR